MELISLLFPACIAMNIRCKRVEKLKTVKTSELIFKWAGWVLAINLWVMVVISYVFFMDGVLSEAFRSFSFFMKYNVIAIVFALVLPYIVEVVEKNIEVSVNLGEKNEENK